jgi:carboxyl-terminal processing protease
MNETTQTIKLNKHSTPYLIVLALILGIGIGAVFTSIFKSPFGNTNTTTFQSNNTNITNLDNKFFNDVTKVIQDNYIGEVPSSKELTYGAIKGFLESLGNQYNSFLTPEEAETYLESRNPNIEGIGVTLKYNGENTIVETVLSNYPAEKAGIKTGDVVLEVNGEAVTGEMPNKVASKVRGDAGTEVKVKVFREGELLEFNVRRERIELENLDYKALENGIYKINIYQFLDTTAEDFNKKWDKIVSEISSKGDAKGIIMDLRNNPGGYVYSVRHVLEEFLSNGKVMMSEQQKNKPKNDFTDTRIGLFENIPLVVLVNEGSASASEIFASAIQDNDRGEIIGKKTVGKGVEQQVMTLDDKSMLILVFQKWLTPSGKNIDPENPVIPDLEVDYTEENVKAGIDPQLNKAKEILK